MEVWLAIGDRAGDGVARDEEFFVKELERLEPFIFDWDLSIQASIIEGVAYQRRDQLEIQHLSTVVYRRQRCC